MRIIKLQNNQSVKPDFMLTTQVTLKVVFATFLPVYFVSLNEGACETSKNVFYFISKALFVVEIIKF